MKNELIKRILSSIVLIPLSLYVIIEGSIFFNLFLLIIFFISIFEWHKMVNHYFHKFLGILFLLVSFYSIHKIRFYSENEYWILLYIVCICILTDIGGYTFGKLFKGPKLTKFSPNKTISGMIGAFLLSTISLGLFVFNSKIIEDSPINLLILTLLISGISQLGDIIISYFKRLYNLKDTGKIIPGHGGLLDRIDGMIFAFPFAYFFFIIDLF
jgi:phosphatidate cytidylyltransferase